MKGLVGASPLSIEPQLRRLRVVQAVLLTTVVSVFPAAAALVFGFGYDRTAAADLVACTYAFGLWALFLAPWFALTGAPRAQRLEQAVIMWLWVTYVTHCTWELGWLLGHEGIAAGRDNPLFYVWWAYIDGGDARYAHPDGTLLMMEALSVANGIAGATGLFLWYRRRQHRRAAILIFMAGAVVHLYSTSLYFGSELLEGLPNVNTASPIDLWVKFVLANAPWLVMPWVVIRWAGDRLQEV